MANYFLTKSGIKIQTDNAALPVLFLFVAFLISQRCDCRMTFETRWPC